MDIKKNMVEYYGMSENDVEITMSSYRPLSIPANHYFLETGNISDRIGLVTKGMLRAFFYDDQANEITTHFYPAGTLVISFDSFNNQVPSKENIIAVEDSEMLVISYVRQKELYGLVPVWQQICKDMADYKNQQAMERAVQLQTLSATERYRRFCDENPEILQKVALRHIASYLGIDIATLSRIRKKI